LSLLSAVIPPNNVNHQQLQRTDTAQDTIAHCKLGGVFGSIQYDDYRKLLALTRNHSIIQHCKKKHEPGTQATNACPNV
jgi:hypothetical protein